MYNLSNEDKKWVDGVWDKIDAKMKTVAKKNINKIPYTTDENGDFDDCATGKWPYDLSWWTNGFWPGYMWLLYVGTGDGLYKEAAENAENLLDGAFAEYDHLHHDVGFMWHISAGVNYRLTGKKNQGFVHCMPPISLLHAIIRQESMCVHGMRIVIQMATIS